MRVSRAVGALGEMLRRELSSDGSGSMSDFVTGQPTPRSDLEGALGTDVVELLITDGLFQADSDMVTLAVVMLATRDMLTIAPDVGDRTDRVYMGLDSAYLIEAALRLAPAGERAADLGTGTGLLAAILSRRYQVVVATDVVARAAAAAQLTLALNRAGDEHVGGRVGDRRRGWAQIGLF